MLSESRYVIDAVDVYGSVAQPLGTASPVTGFMQQREEEEKSPSGCLKQQS